MKAGDEERFALYVIPEPNSGCHLWLGSEVHGGYGHFYLDGKMVRAHRAAWVLSGREIPPGLCVLHKCDTRLCVNPDHLFLGRVADNQLDMARKGRGRRGPLPRGLRMSRAGRYIAEVGRKGEHRYLGSFTNKQEAELAVAEAIASCFGRRREGA